ncbi:MAG TPA: DUF3017 domain-containing protein [Pedococcus sp.]
MSAPRLRWWWAPVPVLLAGLALLAVDRVRLGGYVLAAALALGALLRLVLPASASGGLVVRSRTVDVVTMALLAGALFLVTAVLDLRPLL